MLNSSIGILLLFLVPINLITMYFLKTVQLKDYFLDIIIVTVAVCFCAASFITGDQLYLFGVLVCGIKILSLEALFKYVFLFGGIGICLLLDNTFYAYSSMIILALYSLIRLVESIIEFTLYNPEEGNDQMPEIKIIKEENVDIPYALSERKGTIIP